MFFAMSVSDFSPPPGPGVGVGVGVSPKHGSAPTAEIIPAITNGRNNRSNVDFMTHTLSQYTIAGGRSLRGVGSLAPITVIEANDVVEVVGRDLEQSAVGGGDHSVKGPWGDVKNRPSLQNLGLEALHIFAGNQLEFAIEDSKSFVLDLVILEAQGLPFPDEQDLADIVGGLSEDLFVSPGFLDYPRQKYFHFFLYTGILALASRNARRSRRYSSTSRAVTSLEAWRAM
jgi:hypothetical protein